MGTTIIAWFQVANMAANVPVEHTKQVATYKEQMQCLREKRCYSFLDQRDNVWVIREKEVAKEVQNVQPEPTVVAQVSE